MRFKHLFVFTRAVVIVFPENLREDGDSELVPSLSSFREDTPKTLSPRPLYSPHIAYLHSQCRYICVEKRTETQLEKKSQEIDDIWPFPLSRSHRLRNFVLPDSIQTSGCIISPLPL